MRDMTQLLKLWKLTKGTFFMILALAYVVYLYGMIGFIKASMGRNDKKVDDYVIPLFWNFVTIATTLILIFKK